MSFRHVYLACIGLAVAALSILWWRAIAWYPALPERIPVHFGIGGTPDRWSERGASWFTMPCVGTGMLVAFAGIPLIVDRLAVRSPGLVNMPNKELFLRLSPAGRMRALAPLRAFLPGIGALTSLVFAYVIEGSARVAVGEADRLQLWPFLVLMGGMFAATIGFMVIAYRAVDQVAREEGVLPPARRRPRQ